MNYSTTDTYKMKREIINFSKKFSSRLFSPETKFLADMTYGIVSSKSCLLTQISQRLQENTKKRYTVDRLSDHLSHGTPHKALADYLRYVRRIVPSEPVIHIDDSDVIKPEGYHFESLGIVRDGSRSTPEKSVYCKGYHVTEACVLTSSNHPVSIFSEVHSSTEKSFTSMNDITFSAINRGTELFRKATYVMDRGYDDNKIFRKLKTINALNFYISIAMAFLAHMTRKKAANTLLKSVLDAARPIKDVDYSIGRNSSSFLACDV